MYSCELKFVAESCLRDEGGEGEDEVARTGAEVDDSAARWRRRR